MNPRYVLAALLLLAVRTSAAQQSTKRPTPGGATPCAQCAEWNKPRAGFRVFGNSWYVDTEGLAAIFITSPEGHVLIDGALPESAPQIMANIRTLGFRVEDVKLILSSHAHFDHAGGIAALQRASGARVAAHPWSAAFLKQSNAIAGDPQFDINPPYPPVNAVHVLRDREVMSVGSLRLTAHFTGGHTPGGTTWSWRSCEGERCLDIVYADSQTPVSADGFLFTRNTTYPNAVRDFETSFATLEQLRCDVLITPHPGVSGTFEKLAAREGGKRDAFVVPTACRALAASARLGLEKRLATEGARE